MENTSYPREIEKPKKPKQETQQECLKCLRPVDPDCDICWPWEYTEDQAKSIFDVLWMNCTKRAFESKKRRLW